MRHTADERGNDLATVLRSAAVPYGYTVTVWGTGMMLTRERGLPSVAEIFLFVLGAVAGFAVLGLIVRLTGGMPSTPSYGALLRTGMIQFVAVGIALGSTLAHRTHPRRHGLAVGCLRRDGNLSLARDP